MEPKPQSAKHIRSILKTVLPKYNLSGRKSRDEICDAWREAAGETAADRSSVSSLKKGVLQVIVASTALKHELENFRREEILGLLKTRLPEKNIKKLKFIIK